MCIRDRRNLSTGEIEVEGSAIYHVTEYRERRNHYAVYAVFQGQAGDQRVLAARHKRCLLYTSRCV